ncbi:MAG: polysaccharide biosynthesis/export family protein, partial [bacterium]|nr:polysaccharide biosynthesis/export family protein [bacterium]
VAPGRVGADPLTGSAIAVQAYHQLLPNDYVRIVVNAGDVFSYDRTLDANGNIALPLIGNGSPASPPVHVEGLTVSGVEAKLQEMYARYYKAPSVNVGLLSIGRAQVMLVFPEGRFSVRSMVNGQTLYDMLSSFMGGGLEYRYAYVVRGGYEMFRQATRQTVLPLGEMPALPFAESGGGGVIESGTSMGLREALRLETLLAEPGAQLFALELSAMRSARPGENLELRAGDIIFLSYGPREASVPVNRKLVSISGVTRPGTYQLLPGETLRELLQLSGFRESPNLDLRNVLIERRDASGKLGRLVLNLDPVSGGGLDLGAVELAHRDTVRITGYINQVFVVGSVQAGGAYGFNAAFKALDYIALAGGPAADAHLKFVKIVRHERIVGAEKTRPQMFNINIADDFNGVEQDGYSIMPGDILYIPPKGFEPNLRDITSALNTVFLGFSFFDDLLGNGNGVVTP